MYLVTESCLDEVLKTLRGLEKDLDGFEVERLLSGTILNRLQLGTFHTETNSDELWRIMVIMKRN
jgi:hypothetical protein